MTEPEPPPMQQTPTPIQPTARPALPEAVERKRQSDRVQPRRTVNELFRTFANGTAKVMGSPWTFFGAVLLIILWASSYRLFVPPGANEDQWKKGFDTWQLIINTATTIITFLMVFLIQNTQNRDAKAIHLKLDELIRAVTGARTHLVDLENLTDEELDRLEREFRRIHEREKRKAEMPAGASANGKH
jgi:low affinity Fe/Cu permease